MFEVKHLIGNTYYYDAFTNVGIYKLNESEAVLIDSCDHKRMVKGLDRELQNMGLSVSLIINTHSHFDHICGNRYFQDKYGCRLLSTRFEQGFILNPELEDNFYSVALGQPKSTSLSYGTQPSQTEIITGESLPEGFETVELPGHSFEMIGVRTPDDVLFLADSVLSALTWDNYRLPFFYNVNKSLDTFRAVRNMKARLFVPSHNPPLEDISELADYNIKKLKEKKSVAFDLCDGKSLEQVFDAVMKAEGLEIKMPKYCMYAVMVKNLMQSLIEDELVYTALENNRVIYHTK